MDREKDGDNFLLLVQVWYELYPSPCLRLNFISLNHQRSRNVYL